MSARAALYASLAALFVGVAGASLLGRSSLLDGWPSLPGFGPKAADVRSERGWSAGGTPLVVVDRAGRQQRTIAANRPWTPRFSPDGRRVAYGAFGPGRSSSDVWVTDLVAGTTQRITDSDADNNDPQWSPDGATVAYSANAPSGKDLVVQPIGGEASVLAQRAGTQFPNDWLRDGSALLITDQGEHGGSDILVQPADGSAARPYAATPAQETAARVSPDGHWIAYTSDESGRAEVYLDSYPERGRRVTVSSDGGIHPVWRGDGRELYYWRDGALVAVQLDAAWGDAPPKVGRRTVLFRAPYNVGANTMYDVSPDGQRFVIVQHVWN